MTTQPNTEPLKVGDECREAFELDWMHAQEAADAAEDESLTDTSKRIAWHFYQAAWNRRTEPSPAEGGSDGLPELPDDLKADISGLCTAAITGDPDGLCRSIHERIKAYARQALSQQSPVRVEGEREAFEKYAISGGLDLSLLSDGESYASWKTHGAWSAWQARSALNQRLAVKKVESGPLEDSFGVIVDHPVSDDQQAKDAALLRDLLEEARDDVCECLNQMMVFAGYPSGDERIARQREFLARIDAALSTTKQEEV